MEKELWQLQLQEAAAATTGFHDGKFSGCGSSMEVDLEVA